MKDPTILDAAKHIRQCNAAEDKVTKSQLELDTFRCGGPQREFEHEICYCDGCVAKRLDEHYGMANVKVGDEHISLEKLAQLFKLWDMRGAYL